MQILGIDIGGTGIKGAPVDLTTAALTTERFRVETPRPAKPKAVAKAVQKIVDHFNWKGPIGFGFPTVIVNGKAMAYGNMHKSWLGVQIDKLFSEKTGLPCVVINDADAAGMAEVRFGSGKNINGLVLTITVGTGIGSGLYNNGILIPNFELGRIPYNNEPIEKYVANSVRKAQNLTYKQWAHRFNFFLDTVESICTPDQYIIGGGISKHMDEFKKYITTDIPFTAAQMKNNAGIIGAACAYEAKINS
ncbi:polyphosphate--glucose phosphotransferase [Dokdonia sp. Hel_I_53]|uniref:polyphosphate--glucose phosphotransferase n=1 Tax=Dokdonia sp. Hel_I_53 TaxID=1566287 RepID=UPI0011998C61|nr:ROK family protein [Dokdonia sp. Hel_I_53]TVZ51632.1 polyphosphate glucokinase [Dokdonia sp. Hel_I_53]